MALPTSQPPALGKQNSGPLLLPSAQVAGRPAPSCPPLFCWEGAAGRQGPSRCPLPRACLPCSLASQQWKTPDGPHLPDPGTSRWAGAQGSVLRSVCRASTESRLEPLLETPHPVLRPFVLLLCPEPGCCLPCTRVLGYKGPPRCASLRPWIGCWEGLGSPSGPLQVPPPPIGHPQFRAHTHAPGASLHRLFSAFVCGRSTQVRPG